MGGLVRIWQGKKASNPRPTVLETDMQCLIFGLFTALFMCCFQKCTNYVPISILCQTRYCLPVYVSIHFLRAALLTYIRLFIFRVGNPLEFINSYARFFPILNITCRSFGVNNLSPFASILTSCIRSHVIKRCFY